MNEFEEFLEKSKETEKEESGQIAPTTVFETLASTDTEQTMLAIKNQAMLDLVSNSDEVKAKVEENAKAEIDTHLDIQAEKTKNKKIKAKFVGNEEACKIYGVERSVPLWQQKLMSIGSAVWFVVYFAFASLIIAPISTFAFKLNVVFKKMWIAILTSILIYMFVAFGIPLLVAVTS